MNGREQGDDVAAVKVHGHSRCRTEGQGDQGTLADAHTDAVKLTGTVVLRRIDGHGNAEGNHGLQGQLFDFRRRYEAGNRLRSEGVADRLEDQDPHGNDEELNRHGKAQAQVLPGKGPIKLPVRAGQTQHGKPLFHKDKTQDGRHALGDDQGDGRSRYAPAEDDDEQEGQCDVQERRDDEEIKGRPTVPQGPAYAGQEVVSHHGHESQNDDDHVVIGIVIEDAGYVHNPQDQGHGQAYTGRNHEGNGKGQHGRCRHRTAQAFHVFGAEALADNDRKTGRQTDGHAKNGHIDRGDGADSR